MIKVGTYGPLEWVNKCVDTMATQLEDVWSGIQVNFLSEQAKPRRKADIKQNVQLRPH